MLLADFIKYRARVFQKRRYPRALRRPGGACLHLAVSCPVLRRLCAHLLRCRVSAAAWHGGALGVQNVPAQPAAAGIFPRACKRRRRIRQSTSGSSCGLCDAVAILEACILTETGFRANDGNFDWGSLALYPILFSVSIALLMRSVWCKIRIGKTAAAHGKRCSASSCCWGASRPAYTVSTVRATAGTTGSISEHVIINPALPGKFLAAPFSYFSASKIISLCRSCMACGCSASPTRTLILPSPTLPESTSIPSAASSSTARDSAAAYQPPCRQGLFHRWCGCALSRQSPGGCRRAARAR